MKIDEYEPVIRPTSRATAKSWRATAPKTHDPITSSDRTGSTAARLVLIERISVWFIDRLTISLYVVRPPSRRLVFSCTLSNTTMVS